MRPRAHVPATIVRLLPGSAARRVCVLLGGAAGLVLVLAVVLTSALSHRRPGRPVGDVMRRARATPAVVPSTTPTVPTSPDDARDAAALAYYRSTAPAVAAHVREVMWTSPILRVYTDLPGTEANSRTAVALCQAGAAYLEGRGRAPVVFVHARERDGYPVLANKMNSKDGCRLGRVP